MKSTLKSSHEHMWKELHRELVDLSAEKHIQDMPEIKMMCAIIVQAGIDHDETYFIGKQFYYHCYLLKLHQNFVLSLFKRAWRIEKSGVLWEFTPPLLEDSNVD